ncbi:DUF1223 domain-containing protein [Sphingobium algorifonticola]|uniref:DUF1223 domain-containing protein n=1 Tax=Sphingobium algorifonticola TaxID=2008318 RepID=A0A437J709_9SPHN|nr:DUF1223 domain-containing protein [Sphingobium algorifonticola]RVT40968.1 DUF1223 domain-containing protein [Sphingobium algorifonticola]
MFLPSRLLLGAVVAFVAIGAAQRPLPAKAPVVVELFTSQGCSSCPPADAFMGTLAARPDLVALTRPVTYWDRLGWKDTLGRTANTQLQNGYAARQLRGAGVYTPQIVVQGGDAAVGSNRGGVAWLIDRAKPISTLDVVKDGGGRIVQLRGGSGGATEVKLVALKAQADVRIGRGENGGRTVRYHNVVLDERVIGRWNGGAARLAVPASALRVRGADRYAVIVQRPGPGAIVAAHYL